MALNLWGWGDPLRKGAAFSKYCSTSVCFQAAVCEWAVGILILTPKRNGFTATERIQGLELRAWDDDASVSGYEAS